MEWASNNKYRFLKTFTEWVNETIFFPLRGIRGITVRVEVTKEEVPVSTTECTDCNEMLLSSDILDLVDAVNWHDIKTLNLKMIVSFHGRILWLNTVFSFFRIGDFIHWLPASRVSANMDITMVWLNC